MTRHILVDLFHHAEELDVLGPWEVFSVWTHHHPEDEWAVHLVSDDDRPRTGAKGLLLTPTTARSDLPCPEVIVEPGGKGARTRLMDSMHLGWLRQQAAGGALIASVCTGALILAAAGLLRERPATTFHRAFGELLTLDPSVAPRPQSRWVDAGPVVTSAGVSAGIDMALYLVGRLAGVERALQVQEEMEYQPAPPTWRGTAEEGAG